LVFNSNIFLFAFLPITFILFWLSRDKTQRYVLLALSGFVFYGWWDWRFCGLLLFSALFSFGAGLLIERFPDRSRGIAYFSVAVDLAILGVFKYYSFFIRSLRELFPGLPLPLLEITLPIGISFYTFHTISYVLDVNARRVRAATNVFEYVTYVNLFSQLVAGPIVRFRQIENDLANIDGPLRPNMLMQGLQAFTIGMVKKVIIADQIAQYLNPALQDVSLLSTSAAWTVAFAYSLQLYFDFSGYSDMAVGLGCLFGLHIPVNFAAPYRASGIADFWRRWHISLSSWLRDYLYIGLGGNRRGELMTYRNLMLTMTLGGLWHGANWTFIVWGIYHGLLLSLEKMFGGTLQRVPQVVRQVVTYLLVVLGWVPFRSDNFQMASTWFHRMFVPTGPDGFHSVPVALSAWVLVGLVLIATVPETSDIRVPSGRKLAFAGGVVLFFCYLFINDGKSVFLYYQF
jgi:alginate O-acetyltransferase complex protein AlgI